MRIPLKITMNTANEIQKFRVPRAPCQDYPMNDEGEPREISCRKVAFGEYGLPRVDKDSTSHSISTSVGACLRGISSHNIPSRMMRSCPPMARYQVSVVVGKVVHAEDTSSLAQNCASGQENVFRLVNR